MLDLITMQAFRDELVKIAGVMDDAAREGIQLAKKLKARGLAGKLRGNTLKDYVHHMDLSAHPKFKAPGTGGGTQKNFSDAGMLAHAGIKKVGAGGLSPALSMGGLAGLTALEGSQAFNKKKSKKERGMAAASAGATGSILAAEGIHNFGEAASKVKGLASGAGKAAAKPKVDASKMLEQIKSMKRTGQTGTISAKTFGKAAAAYNFDKEAFIGKLLGKAAPAAKSAFKPSFAGHAKSLGVGAATNAKGVTTTKSFNNLSQSMSKKKHIEIPGLA
jgi:hypothetical protein